MNEQYQLVAVSYHRNGIGGNGFHVVLFSDHDQGLMVANVFDERGSVAVLNVQMLVDGNIEFAKGNSWRGDHYEPWLREQIHRYETELTEKAVAWLAQDGAEQR